MLENRLMDINSRAGEVNQQIEELTAKNPNASPDEFIKNQAGAQVANPNFDKKYADLVSQQNRWNSEWQKSVQMKQVLDKNYQNIQDQVTIDVDGQPVKVTGNQALQYMNARERIELQKAFGLMAASQREDNMKLREEMNNYINSIRGENLQVRKDTAYDALVTKFNNDKTSIHYQKIEGLANRLERAKKSYDKNGEAGILDDALLYALQKMNDADSAVLIGEYARTADLQSWVHSIVGKVDNITKSNAKIAPEFRDELFTAVASAIKDKSNAYNQRVDVFRDLGSKYESDRDRINMTFPKSEEVFGKQGSAVSGLSDD